MHVKPSYIVHVCSLNLFTLVVTLTLPFFRLIDLWALITVSLKEL